MTRRHLHGGRLVAALLAALACGRTGLVDEPPIVTPDGGCPVPWGATTPVPAAGSAKPTLETIWLRRTFFAGLDGGLADIPEACR